MQQISLLWYSIAAMIRLIILAVVVLAQQPAKLPESSGISKPNDTIVSKQSNGGESNENTPINTPSIAAQAQNGDQNAYPTDENINIQRKLVLFTGLLVVAAFVTAGVIAWQSWETRKSAKAATASVKAMIATERAWLTAALMRQATKFADGQWYKTEPYKVALNEDEVRDGYRFTYKLRVTNIGKTPARIAGFEVRYTRLAKGVTKLPANSGDVIICENDERIISEKPVDLFQMQIDGYMARARLGKNHADDSLVFHGWVKYRPLIDPSEDSFADYCYVYNPENEVLVRRDEYNTSRQDRY